MPQDAASLSESDNNVEITNSTSHHSRQYSNLEASWPLTSESEGMFDNQGNSGEEEVDNDNLPQHIFAPSRGSSWSKSSQVSIVQFVYILLMLRSFFFLSAPTNMMLH